MNTSAQREAKKRISMSLEFDDLLSFFQKQTNQKQKNQKEQQTILHEILQKTIQKVQVKVEGNQYTSPEFVAEEFNIQAPVTIGECSVEVYNGLARLKELDLFEQAKAQLDIDNENPEQLNIDINLKEKRILTASAGAAHSATSLTPVTGNMTIGIRNLFGHGEKLDVNADVGISTSNQYNLNAFQNVSNEYSVVLTHPRVLLPKYVDPLYYLDKLNALSGKNVKEKSRRIGPDYKYSLSWRGFKQSLDRSRSSSYKEESTGGSVNLISPNKEHVLSYHGHFRSLIASPRQGVGVVNSVSASIGDEQVPSFKSSLSYRFSKDTRDHLAIPSRGYHTSTEMEFAGLGGDVDFFKCMTGFQFHSRLPFSLPAILNVGIRSGVVFPWKNVLHKFNVDAGGGDMSVRIVDRIIPFAGLQCRGYNHAQIGPCHNNDYIHCDYILNGGLSLTFPIFDWLFGNIFANGLCCGLLDRKLSTEKLLDDHHGSVGASLVIPFVVGRLEVGYAFPFQRQNDPFQGKPFWGFDVSFL